LSGNNLEEEVWVYSHNENAMPLLFNKKDSTYEKVNKLPLQSPLTVFFWRTWKVNLEVRHSFPFRKNVKLLLNTLEIGLGGSLRGSES
jgi:hypothetical protein